MERAEIERAYDAVADSYAELIQGVEYEDAHELELINRFVERVGVGRAAAVLDAGCGTGRMFDHLATLDPTLRLSGFDVSSQMVRRAKQRHPAARTTVAALSQIPHADASCEGVLAWYSIIHTPPTSLHLVLTEIARVLRPGGQLVMGFHAGTGVRVAEQAYGHDVRLQVQLHKLDHVAETFAATGFEVIVSSQRPAQGVEKNAQGVVLGTLASDSL